MRAALSEYLAAILKHSYQLEAGTGTDSDFIDLQRLEARITDAYKEGQITAAQAGGLSTLAADLHQEYRKQLKLDL